MKQVGHFSKLIAYGVSVLAVFVATAAQAGIGKATVRAVRGTAEYTQGTESGPLKVGKILKPGAVVKTAANSQVDLFLDQNGPVVRVNQSASLALDKLSFEQTGIDTVIETELNLKSGEILGNVKKLAKTSTYEVKTPTGVAGIRGTQFSINADSGAVTVISGTVMVSYVNAAGVPTVLKVEAGQTFTPPADRNVIPTQTAVATTPPAVEAAATAQVVASTTVSNPKQLQAVIQEIATAKAATAAAAAPPGQAAQAAAAAAQAVVSAASATAQAAAQSFTGSGKGAIQSAANQLSAQANDIKVNSSANAAGIVAASAAAIAAKQGGASDQAVQAAAQTAGVQAAAQAATAAGASAQQVNTISQQAQSTAATVANIVTTTQAGQPAPTVTTVTQGAISVTPPGPTGPTLPPVVVVTAPPAQKPPVDPTVTAESRRKGSKDKLKSQADAYAETLEDDDAKAAAEAEAAAAFDREDKTPDGSDSEAFDRALESAKQAANQVINRKSLIRSADQDTQTELPGNTDAAKAAHDAAVAAAQFLSGHDNQNSVAYKAGQAAADIAARAIQGQQQDPVGQQLGASTLNAYKQLVQTAADVARQAYVAASQILSANQALFAAQKAAATIMSGGNASPSSADISNAISAGVAAGGAVLEGQLFVEQPLPFVSSFASEAKKSARNNVLRDAETAAQQAFPNEPDAVSAAKAEAAAIFDSKDKTPDGTDPAARQQALDAAKLAAFRGSVVAAAELDAKAEQPGNQDAIAAARAAAQAAAGITDVQVAFKNSDVYKAILASADLAARGIVAVRPFNLTAQQIITYNQVLDVAADVARRAYTAAKEANQSDNQANVAAREAALSILQHVTRIPTPEDIQLAITAGINAGAASNATTAFVETPLQIASPFSP